MNAREETTRRELLGLAAIIAGVLVATAADAQGTIRIGLVMPYSGQFAGTAQQMDNAIKLYVKQLDGKLVNVAIDKIENVKDPVKAGVKK